MTTSGRQWTEPQRQAIAHAGGDLLVSAAAGSGKTAVLAERCARLACDVGADHRPGIPRCGIENLLVVTFTQAAANEMRGRIAQAIRDTLQKRVEARAGAAEVRWLRRQASMADRASISTLHAFCARVLRQYFHEAQLDPTFEVMDEEEARLLREDVFEKLFARWHALPERREAGALDAGRFADFFEAYGTGREPECRGLILRLHQLLASTEDPKKFVREARAAYGEGAQETLNEYVSGVLAGQLRLDRSFAAWALEAVPEEAAVVRRCIGEVEQRLGQAEKMLRAQGANAWEQIQAMISYDWPTLRKPAEMSTADMDEIKHMFVEPFKKRLAGLRKRFAADPKTLLEDLRQLAAPLDTYLALTEEFQHAFGEAKRANNQLDFNDLERLTLDLLTKKGGGALHELRRRYHHVLVDESQDINPLQHALLEALRSPERFDGRGNLFVVGDVKQSIYGFRLADPELFLERERAARAAARHEQDVPLFVALPHNFRSNPALIDAMNGMFERLLTREVAGVDYQDGHALEAGATWPTAVEGAPRVPVEMHVVATAADEAEEEEEGDAGKENSDAENDRGDNLSAVEHEARMVAGRMAALLAERRLVRDRTTGEMRCIEPRDIAILLRAMKDKAMIFARELAARGIPFHAELSGGYFDTPEVRDMLALLQVLDNPQQDIPLATAMLGCHGRFSHDDLALIRLSFDRREVAFCEAAARYAEAEGQLAPGGPAFSADLAARLRTFFDQLAAWRQMLRSRPLHEGLAEIYAEAKLFPYLMGLDMGAQRVANLQMLHQRALQFATFRKQGLTRFLRFMERLLEQGEGDLGEAPVLSEASNVVRLMSIHRSKGLEFPVVFVSGLGNKFHLHAGGLIQLHRRLGVGMQVADVERNVTYESAASLRIAEAARRAARAEELRLLYVALTRARDFLMLTGFVKSQDEVERWQRTWRGFRGPLPEDVILRGNRALDWVMPAICSSENGDGSLRVTWAAAGDLPAPAGTHVLVALHPLQNGTATPEKSELQDDDTTSRILACEPLPDVAPAAVQEVADLLERVTGVYAHEPQTRRPAVQTVTFLKTQPARDQENEEPVVVAATDLQALDEQAARHEAQADAARLRGIATHRVLELLDFAACEDAGAIDAQVERLREQHRLTTAEAGAADRTGIAWLLCKSAAGRRLRAAAQQAANGQPGVLLCREIPFAHVIQPAAEADAGAPLFARVSDDAADYPTVRGVIDALLVNRAARTGEIFDYKTDSAFLWQQRLDDYRRQMRYYLRAASAILGFPVKQATLLFLSPCREVVIPAE